MNEELPPLTADEQRFCRMQGQHYHCHSFNLATAWYRPKAFLICSSYKYFNYLHVVSQDAHFTCRMIGRKVQSIGALHTSSMIQLSTVFHKH